MIDILPEKFVRLMREAHAADGEKWLGELPKLIGEIEAEMGLRVGEPFENLSYHFVAPCLLSGGREAVLKIGFPEADSPTLNEAAMLRIYNGNGAVELLRGDERRRALLLERLQPGENLKRAFPNEAEKAVETAIEVLHKIRRNSLPASDFVRLENWFDGFRKAEKTDFPATPLEKARRFYEELSKREEFLIHGDFHHENVLSAARAPFLAIDPKGVVGQIGYEISVFLNNHGWWLAKEARLREKLDGAVSMFSDAFDIDKRELREWAYAQAVLSAWWTFEDNGENWKTDLDFAEVWEV
ncbi:MAG TPA: aminoglycoside phosphotransferase family protein [Pyrinomonadaceae bacterium]|jgi:streptomycin 6-kinase